MMNFRTHRSYLAIDDRVIRAACVARGKIRFPIDAANRAELVSNAVAGSLAGRLEAGQSENILSFTSNVDCSFDKNSVQKDRD